MMNKLFSSTIVIIIAIIVQDTLVVARRLNEPSSSSSEEQQENGIITRKTQSCTVCSDDPTTFMSTNGFSCEGSPNLLANNCNGNPAWVAENSCQLSCYNINKGYDGDVCCDDGNTSNAPPPPPPPANNNNNCNVCSDVENTYMSNNGFTCEGSPNMLANNCNGNPAWVTENYCQLSCYKANKGYDGDVCCDSQGSNTPPPPPPPTPTPANNPPPPPPPPTPANNPPPPPPPPSPAKASDGSDDCTSGPFDRNRDWKDGFVIFRSHDKLCSGETHEFGNKKNPYYIRQHTTGELVINKGTVGGKSNRVWSNGERSLGSIFGMAHSRLQDNGELITRNTKTSATLWTTNVSMKKNKTYFMGVTKKGDYLQIWKGSPSNPKTLLVAYKLDD